MGKILDGKAIAKKIRSSLKEKVATLGEITPGLSVILVGEDPASQIYVRNKERACQEVGIHSSVYRLSSKISEKDLLSKIDDLNQDDTVDGILVQLPLPKQIDPEKVIRAIKPDKDVDGFHPENIGALAAGRDAAFLPCTPLGILRLLDEADIPIAGKRAIVIGRSAIVGRPVSLLLLSRDATVTMAHSKTQNLAQEILQADIVVAAVGKAEMIQGEWIQEGAAVIDVGINRVEGRGLLGDVEFEAAKERARAITPVPGGVGPMTIALLLENTVRAAERRFVRSA